MFETSGETLDVAVLGFSPPSVHRGLATKDAKSASLKFQKYLPQDAVADQIPASIASPTTPV